MSALWLLVNLMTIAEPDDVPESLAVRAGGTTSIEAGRSAEAAAPGDRRDLVLLLDGGPLHFRVRLALGGRSLIQSRQAYIDRLMTTLDADGDGKLTRKEAARSPLFRTKNRPSANSFLEGLQNQAAMTRREMEQRIEAKGNNLVSYHDHVSSSKNDQEVFSLLDRDGSGVLDTAELLAAAELIVSKDADGDQCVSFEEFVPPPPPPDPMQVALGAESPITQLAKVSDLVVDAGNALFGDRLRRKYDHNRDLQLDAGELGWSAQRIETLDANHDGKLNVVELRHLAEATPDAELTVDLAAVGSEGGRLHVGGTSGKRMDDAARIDYAKVAFQPAIVTFSERSFDPQAAALDDAMRKFNSLDADANGYLTREETAERLRFERELFELIDIDGDEKIFADEMREYVLALSEPATTTCRVNVHDAGNGFFMTLDTNADGRISERERRGAAAALAALDRDGRVGIGQNEPVRHFHLEFVRGAYQLFGPIDPPAAQATGFQRRQLPGPIWFQRMDRNNDGDLIWNEFLGPRWVFDQLDADGDELLDPQEAAKWQPKAATTRN